jgi:hypothetical protein
MGMGYWTEELAEIDQGLTSRYLRQLALIADPKTTPTTKRKAELKRRELFQQICAGARGVS